LRPFIDGAKSPKILLVNALHLNTALEPDAPKARIRFSDRKPGTIWYRTVTGLPTCPGIGRLGL